MAIRFDLESTDFPDGTYDFEFFLMIYECYPRAIISSIFEALETCEDFLVSISATTEISEDSAHSIKKSEKFWNSFLITILNLVKEKLSIKNTEEKAKKIPYLFAFSVRL